jgi:class 3 adenylate cyclase
VKAPELTSSIRLLLPAIARDFFDLLAERNLPGADLTILFTDIDGYTATTERLGDRAAQALVRAHDRIVRAALSLHGGREVKHTGDGIMAFFTSAASAVDCALEIQTKTEAYNRGRRREPLRVAIGLNSGSPIREGGDLHGTPVIVAARAVDLAAGGEVVVTDVVRQLTAGKGLQYDALPEVTLEGFSEAAFLYRVSRQGEGLTLADDAV